MTITYIELHTEVAAEVLGADLSRSQTDKEIDSINVAINQYSVLVFHDQNLNDDHQIRFSRMFGELEEEHVGYYSYGKIGYIGRVGNIDDDGNMMQDKSRGVRAQTGNEMWHSDSSFRENPSLYSVLYAHEVPSEEGNTEFVSARTAYQRLDGRTQSLVDPLVGIHDYIYSRTKISEDAVTIGQRTFMRPVRQRLVRANPMTGEKNLFLGSHLREIEGWEGDQSQELITRLMKETTRPKSVYRHHWRVGDLVIWDNRCVLHQTRVRGAGPTLIEKI